MRRLQQGHVHNVRFGDFVDLVLAFGFEETRSRGSHRLFSHQSADAFLNLQPAGGRAKDYQVREFLRIANRYHLELEAE